MQQCNSTPVEQCNSTTVLQYNSATVGNLALQVTFLCVMSLINFLPQLRFPGTKPLEVIYQTRLLGITLTSDLLWTSHVNDMANHATAKLWTLARFNSLGGSKDQLFKLFLTRI